MSYPNYSKSEVKADRAVHLAGIMFSTIAGPILIWYVALEGETIAIIAVSIYVVTLLAMFFASAVYNLTSRKRPIKALFRRLDHSAIYLKIAGVYTPFAALSMGGGGRRLLIGVWVAALSGLGMKMVLSHRHEVLSLFLYVGIGWAAAPFLSELLASISYDTAILLFTGGALYMIGIGFHLWTRLAYHNAIWHGFVLVATTVIYAAIATEYA
ncbi:MAG: PAQR family membrane homeostasis protein TrhA [Pikeienuella sp.]